MAAEETLLIVDDTRLARKMVRSFVTKARPDIAIFEAADGEEALRVATESSALFLLLAAGVEFSTELGPNSVVSGGEVACGETARSGCG